MCGGSSSSLIETSSSRCTSTSQKNLQDIEDLHAEALRMKSTTYIDPETGFTVFTEYAHLKKGSCCGFKCRHCPYGWENVHMRNEDGQVIRRQPKVRSGDKNGCKQLIEKIESGEYLGQKLSSHNTMDNESDDDSCQSQIEYSIQESDSSPQSSRKIKTGGKYGGLNTNKNVPYTRGGDSGTSQLLTGERRLKDDIAFEAMGTVDELCSFVGTAHAEMLNSSDDFGNLEGWLLDIMSRLFDIGSHIAKPKKDNFDAMEDSPKFQADGVGNGFAYQHVQSLEEWIDDMTDKLPELNSFILPTGSKLSSQLHVARCVCRRTERIVLPLIRDGTCDPNALKYLNRLSDFLFTAARWSNYCAGQDEVQYKRHCRGAKQRDLFVVDLNEEKKSNV